MTIKAIIFDLGGVILKTKENNLCATIAKKLNAPKEAVYELFHGDMHSLIDLGEITQDEFNTFVVDELQISRDKRCMIEQVFNEELTIDTALMEKIADLRKEYEIGMLSNFSNDLRGKLETKWKISGAFDEILISSEIGLIKPDAAIYELMLEKLGVSAREAVFVDDHKINITGAKAVGLRTILFENREQTLEELGLILGEQ